MATKSRLSYATQVRQHILPSLGQLRLADLKPEDARRLARECKQRGLSQRSIKYTDTIFKSALKDARVDGLIGADALVVIIDGFEDSARRAAQGQPVHAG